MQALKFFLIYYIRDSSNAIGPYPNYACKGLSTQAVGLIGRHAVNWHIEWTKQQKVLISVVQNLLNVLIEWRNSYTNHAGHRSAPIM